MKTRTLLSRLIDNKPASLVGMDIGSTAVKMVVGGYEKEDFVVRGAWQIEVAEADTKETDRVLAIHSCLQKSGLKTPYAVCALSGPEVVLSRFQFPSLPTHAVRQAVELEAQQVCPFDFEQCVLDYQLVSTPGDQEVLRGFLVMAPRAAVEKKTDWLRQAGGKALYLDIEGLAALNCLTHCTPAVSEETVVLLDIGSGFTNVLIRSHDGIPFIRSLPSGGRFLVSQVSRRLDRPEEEVRAALFGQAPFGADLADALKTAAGKWITDINETLRYCLLQNPGARLSRICLCGGWALSGPLLELLSRSLAARVEIFNPFRDLPMQVSDSESKRLLQTGPVFAVAAGLAMRAIR